MRMSLRVAACMMLVAMLLSLAPVSVFAAEEPAEGTPGVEETLPGEGEGDAGEAPEAPPAETPPPEAEASAAEGEGEAEAAVPPAAEDMRATAAGGVDIEPASAPVYTTQPPYQPLGMKTELPDLYGMGIRRAPYYGADAAGPLLHSYYQQGGHLGVVAAEAGQIKVSLFDTATGLLQDGKSVPFAAGTTLWGGHYFDGTYHYVATGKSNPSGDADATVIVVTRYDADWSTAGTVNVRADVDDGPDGAYRILAPFHGSKASMAVAGGKLILYTSRMMEGGQANLALDIDFTAGTAAPSTQAPWVSHSLNQFVVSDGTSVYFVDHGDTNHDGGANQRGINITKVDNYATPTASTTDLVFPFTGSGNFTGTTVTGVAVTNSNLLITGTSVPHGEAIGGVAGASPAMTKNAYGVTWDGSTTKFDWLTQYDPNTGSVEVSEPNLVPLAAGEVAILYTVTQNEVPTGHFRYYTGVEYSAAITFPRVAFHSSSVPIAMGDDTIDWVGGLTLYNNYGKEGGKDFYLYQMDVSTSGAPKMVEPGADNSKLQDFSFRFKGIVGTNTLLQGDTAAAYVDGFIPSGYSGSKAITLVSKNTAVATVLGNTITAEGVGTAVIEGTVGGVKREVTVTVVAPPTGLTVTPGTGDVYVGLTGSKLQLAATVTPAGASLVTWTSSNPDVAKVDPATGLVTPGTQAGTATITASLQYNPGSVATATAEVTSHLAASNLTLAPAGTTAVKRYQLPAGGSVDVQMKAKPLGGACTSIAWSQADAPKAETGEPLPEKVVEIAGTGEKVTVKAVGRGTSKVTATLTLLDGTTKTADFHVEVPGGVVPKEVTLDKDTLTLDVNDAPYQLAATVLPENAPDKTLLWTSSDEDKATVSPDGTVTPKAAGEATITATARANSEVKASCVVTVEAGAYDAYLSATTLVMGNGETAEVTLLSPPGNSLTMSSVAVDDDGFFDEEGWDMFLVEEEDPGKTKITVTTSATATDITIYTVEVTDSDGGTHELTLKYDPAGYTDGRGVSIDGFEDGDTLSLYMGQTRRLGGRVSTTTDLDEGDTGLVWEVTEGDGTVLEVDAFGVVTALAAGTGKLQLTLQNDERAQPATFTLNVEVKEWDGDVTLTTKDDETIKWVGDSVELILDYGTADTPAWENWRITSGENVVNLLNRKLTAVRPGAATVQVQYFIPGRGVESKTHDVTVKEKPAGIVMPATGVTLYVGEDVTFEDTEFSVWPATAEQDLTYAISGAAASLSTASDIVVTAVQAGTATLTVSSTALPKVEDTITVTVKAAPTSLTFTDDSLNLKPNDIADLRLTPTVATQRPGNITYTVTQESTPGVVQVLGPATAGGNYSRVKALKPGTAIVKLKATAGSSTYEDELFINVGTPVERVLLDEYVHEMNFGESYQLNPVVMPKNAMPHTVTYKSLNTNVARVSTSGLVTTIGVAGSAIIEVSASDGASTKTAQCLVVVGEGTTSVEATPASAALKVNDTLNLGLTLKPSGALLQNANLYCEVVEESTAGVVALDGYKLTAKKNGNATVRLVYYYGDKTFTAYTSIVVAPEGLSPVTGITMWPSEVTLVTGEDGALVPYRIQPATASNQKVDITVGDENPEGTEIIELNGRYMTAKNPGTCQVTVTTEDGGYEATLSVTVVDRASAPALTGVEIVPGAPGIPADAPYHGMPQNTGVTFTVRPVPASAILPSGANYKWEITDAAPANALTAQTADNAYAYTVLGSAKGTAKVKVEVTAGGQTLATTTDVTVGEAVSGVSLAYPSGNGAGGLAYPATPERITLLPGTTLQLTANVTPAGDPPAGALDPSVLWTCSDTTREVLTVSEEGLLTAKAGAAGGPYTVTATTVDGGFAASVVVYVGELVETNDPDPKKTGLKLEDMELIAGDTRPMTLTFNPATAPNKTIKWEVTSGTSYASIDQEGNITGLLTGTSPSWPTATVKATWVDDNYPGGEIYATATVTVVAGVDPDTFRFEDSDFVMELVPKPRSPKDDSWVRGLLPVNLDPVPFIRGEAWTSSNQKVLKLVYNKDLIDKVPGIPGDDNKTVVGFQTVARGTSTVTYTLTDAAGVEHTIRCVVRVTGAQESIKTFKFSKATGTLVYNAATAATKPSTLQLKLTQSPSTVSFKKVEWVVTEEKTITGANAAPDSVITVDENGKVTATGAGTAKVKAVGTYLAYTYDPATGQWLPPETKETTNQCTITVKEYATGAQILDAGTPVTTLRMSAPGYTNGDAAYNRTTVALTTIVAPTTSSDKPVWKLSGTAVGMQKDPADASKVTLTAKKAGSATVTATWGKKKATLKVSVVVPVTGVSMTTPGPVELAVGASKTLATSIPKNPGDGPDYAAKTPTNRKLTWSIVSGGSDIVSLGATTGKIKGLKTGIVTIKAISVDDPTKETAPITVSVVVPVNSLKFRYTGFTMKTGTAAASDKADLIINGGGEVTTDNDNGYADITLTVKSTAPVSFTGGKEGITGPDGVKKITWTPTTPVTIVADAGKNGTAIITATKAKVTDPANPAYYPYATKSHTLTVKVSSGNLVPITSARFDNANKAPGIGSDRASLAVGKTFTPKVLIGGKTAWDKNINWTITPSDPEAYGRYITFNYNTGAVKATAPSQADGVTFTVTGTLTGELGTGVAAKVVEFTFDTVRIATKLAIEKPASTNLWLNKTLELKAVLSPAGTSNQKVKWTSSKPDVATIEGSTDNVLEADKITLKPLKTGSTKITATTLDGSNKSASITIKVVQQVVNVVITPTGESEPKVDKGKTRTLEARVNFGYDGPFSSDPSEPEPNLLPAATNPAVTWEIEEFKSIRKLGDNSFELYNPATPGTVMTINAKTGKVTGKGAGYARVTVKSVDNPAANGDRVYTSREDNSTTYSSSVILYGNAPVTSIKAGNPSYKQANFTIYSGVDNPAPNFTVHAQTTPTLDALNHIIINNNTLVTGGDREDEVMLWTVNDELTWTIPQKWELDDVNDPEGPRHDASILGFPSEYKQQDAANKDEWGHYRYQSYTNGTQAYRTPAGVTTIPFTVRGLAADEKVTVPITVSAASGKSVTLKVTVTGNPTQANRITAMTLNKEATWVTVGKSEKLKTTITRENNKKTPSNPNLEWEIVAEYDLAGNKIDKTQHADRIGSIATVDATGKVVARGAGWAEVKVSTMDATYTGQRLTQTCRVYCVARG